jgi:cysteine desulfurase
MGMSRQIYLDHGATTPILNEVLEEMLPFFKERFGNASTFYKLGREARQAVETARERVATLIHAMPEEIVFTSGGTESNNMAIKGTAFAMQDKGNHIITSAIEHHAVLDTCEYLQKFGFNVTRLPVDSKGLVNPSDLEDAIRDDTILVTIMHANNEIGTIQPLKELAKICNEHEVLFHTDAVQSIGKIPVDVRDLGVDMLSISAHKIYGPKGVGALYIRDGVAIDPFLHGGGQERGKRSGTENVPGIVGLGKAAELAKNTLEDEMKRLTELRDMLVRGILSIDDTFLNGHPEKRLPNNVNVGIRYVEGEALVLALDMKGIYVSTGSACSSGSGMPSHVLTALGLSPEDARGSLRLTLGKSNTKEDIGYVISTLSEIVADLRAMSPLTR